MNLRAEFDILRNQANATKSFIQNPNTASRHTTHLMLRFLEFYLKGIDVAIKSYNLYAPKAKTPILDEIIAAKIELEELKKTI